MAWEFYSWERNTYISDFDQSWGLKVDKFDGDCMNVKIQMAEDGVSFEEKNCCNSVEALPVDPFEMGVKSSWTTVSVWFEGVKGLESDLDEHKSEEGDQLCAELRGLKEDEDLGNFSGSDSYIKDDGLYSDCLPQNVEELLSYALASLCCASNQVDKALETVYPDKEDDVMPDSPSYVDILPENVEELLNHALESLCVFGYQADNSTQFTSPEYDNGEGEGEGGAHEALTYVLNYLGVKDLLSVQGVCKSLNDELKRESHFWRNICIDAELSTRISDDTLLRLTNKAEGTLRSLSLIGCSRITDSGLARVLQSNPGLIMLCVPGCLRLTVDGIVSSLKEFMQTAKPGLRHLRIAGLYGVTNKHIEELKAVLGSDKHTIPKSPKPMFYHMAQRSLACLDDRVLDIDTCPQCQEARLVYDCPVESCRSKTHSVEQCRGCINCIPRCVMCGGCITDCHFTETFCLEYLCWDCVQKPKSRDKKDGNGDIDLKCMIIIQGVHCQCCMLG